MIAACVFAALYLMLAAVVSPAVYDLRAGQVAPATITATRDVEDTITTQKLIAEAERLATVIYEVDDTVMASVLGNLREAFIKLGALHTKLKDGNEWTSDVYMAIEALGFSSLDESLLFALAAVPDETLLKIEEEAIALTRDAIELKLLKGSEAGAVDGIANDLIKKGYARSLVEVIKTVVSANIRPNMIINQEATELRRIEESAKVEPVIYKTNQNITTKGEIITRSQYEMLYALGMIKDQPDLSLYFGCGAIVLLLLGIIIAYLWQFESALGRDIKQALLLAIIMILAMGLSLVSRQWNIFLMPNALAAMLIALLMNPRLALFINIPISIEAGLMASAARGGIVSTAMMCATLSTIISGTLSVVVISRRQNRSGVVIAGAIAGAANIAAIYPVGLINPTILNDVLTWLPWSGVSGALSAVLCLVLQLALEWLFNLVTPVKLIELSNPNHPLLRRLLLEAPGTYHHSIIVANLAEAAASAIGKNGLLARVGAYYHDVGKLKRPTYILENPMGDNPHDRTDPIVSTAILTAHPRDGMLLAHKHRVPQPILDIISQHHGDTPVLFFYDRALKLKDGEPVNMTDFRYDGRKPQTAEAAAVMLADSIEAAARAMPEPNAEKISELVSKMMRCKVDDGQLDDAPITLQDLSKIRDAFTTVLTGAFHERIEYPAIELPQRLPAPKEEKLIKEERLITVKTEPGGASADEVPEPDSGVAAAGVSPL
jgi:putative nucleotidyltransferase with HDIG domain